MLGARLIASRRRRKLIDSRRASCSTHSKRSYRCQLDSGRAFERQMALRVHLFIGSKLGKRSELFVQKERTQKKANTRDFGIVSNAAAQIDSICFECQSNGVVRQLGCARGEIGRARVGAAIHLSARKLSTERIHSFQSYSTSCKLASLLVRKAFARSLSRQMLPTTPNGSPKSVLCWRRKPA